MTFASTRVWLNQGAASTEHFKAGVRANRSTKAASRATCLPYNRNPFVEDPHPSSPPPENSGETAPRVGITPFAAGGNPANNTQLTTPSAKADYTILATF